MHVSQNLIARALALPSAAAAAAAAAAEVGCAETVAAFEGHFKIGQSCAVSRLCSWLLGLRPSLDYCMRPAMEAGDCHEAERVLITPSGRIADCGLRR